MKVTKISGLLLGFLAFYSFTTVSAQEWRQIVPLKTKCQDLQKILEIKSCQYPVTLYQSDKFRMSITFSKKKKVKSSAQVVVQLLIGLNEAIKLKDFETDLTGYKKRRETDVDLWIYENDKKGIQLTTNSIDGEEYIVDVALSPPEQGNKIY